MHYEWHFLNKVAQDLFAYGILRRFLEERKDDHLVQTVSASSVEMSSNVSHITILRSSLSSAKSPRSRAWETIFREEAKSPTDSSGLERDNKLETDLI
jgi:hypothetical protein